MPPNQKDGDFSLSYPGVSADGQLDKHGTGKGGSLGEGLRIR